MEEKKISPNNPNQTENQGGRPLKYTPEELYEKAQEYFDFCDDKVNWIDKGMNGKVPKPKTLSGLCLWLKVSKDYISEKAKDESFSETIKEIRLVVENNIEEGILQNTYNPTSGIFNLKNNFDWKDKSEVDNNLKGNLNISNILGEIQGMKNNN